MYPVRRTKSSPKKPGGDPGPALPNWSGVKILGIRKVPLGLTYTIWPATVTVQLSLRFWAKMVMFNRESAKSMEQQSCNQRKQKNFCPRNTRISTNLRQGINDSFFREHSCVSWARNLAKRFILHLTALNNEWIHLAACLY